MDRVETVAAIPFPETVPSPGWGTAPAWKGVAASLLLHLCAGAAAIGALSVREPEFPPVIDLSIAEEVSGDAAVGPGARTAARAEDVRRADAAAMAETPETAPPAPSPGPAIAPAQNPVAPAVAVPAALPAAATSPPPPAGARPRSDPEATGPSAIARATDPGVRAPSLRSSAGTGSSGPAHASPRSHPGASGAGAGGEGAGATGGNRDGTTGADAYPEGFGRIRDAIQSAIAYPAAARRMGWEGKVLVSFRLLPDGSVRDVRVVRGSGHPVLDRGAVDAVRNASPFPRPPSGAEIVTPVVYRLTPAP